MKLAVDAADHQVLFAPVKLEGFAQFKFERYEGTRFLSFPSPPVANEIGDAAVA